MKFRAEEWALDKFKLDAAMKRATVGATSKGPSVSFNARSKEQARLRAAAEAAEEDDSDDALLDDDDDFMSSYRKQRMHHGPIHTIQTTHLPVSPFY